MESTFVVTMMDSSMLKGVTNLVNKLTSGKANSGLVGLMLNADQVTNWVLCNHICTTLFLAMADIFEESRDDEYDAKTHAYVQRGRW